MPSPGPLRRSGYGRRGTENEAEVIRWSGVRSGPSGPLADLLLEKEGVIDGAVGKGRFGPGAPALGPLPRELERLHPSAEAGISIVEPRHGASVARASTVRIKIRLWGGKASKDVDRVRVCIDDGDWQEATSAEGEAGCGPGCTWWWYAWDTATVKDGWHRIRAIVGEGRAYDEEDVIHVAAGETEETPPHRNRPVADWQGDWGQRLVRGFSQYYEVWQVLSRPSRRAWLCLAILGRRWGRPGGYTRKDIGRLAKAKPRTTQRNVVDELKRLGILKRRRRKGRQPRFHYAGQLKARGRERLVRLKEGDHIRALLEDASNETASGRRGRATGNWARVPGGYVVGEWPYPDWSLTAWILAEKLGSTVLGEALRRVLVDRTAPEPEDLRRYLSHSEGVRHIIHRLCEAMAEAVDEPVRWVVGADEPLRHPILLGDVFFVLPPEAVGPALAGKSKDRDG